MVKYLLFMIGEWYVFFFVDRLLCNIDNMWMFIVWVINLDDMRLICVVLLVCG